MVGKNHYLIGMKLLGSPPLWLTYIYLTQHKIQIYVYKLLDYNKK